MQRASKHFKWSIFDQLVQDDEEEEKMDDEADEEMPPAPSTTNPKPLMTTPTSKPLSVTPSPASSITSQQTIPMHEELPTTTESSNPWKRKRASEDFSQLNKKLRTQ